MHFIKTIKVDINNLVQSISEDNRRAFNLLYEVYYEEVFRMAFYFLQNKEACREVVLDVFFSVWQSRKKLREINNLEADFYIVTRNEAIRFQNKKQNHEHLSIEDIPIRLEIKEEATPEEALLDREIEELLTQVINQLPEKCRLIFLMARQQGLKPKEIGQILSISESTVRVQMKIAIEKIVEKIKPHFPDLTLTVLFTLFTDMLFRSTCN